MRHAICMSLFSLLLFLSIPAFSQNTCGTYFSNTTVQIKTSKLSEIKRKSLEFAKNIIVASAKGIYNYSSLVNQSAFKHRLVFRTPDDDNIFLWGGLFTLQNREVPKSKWEKVFYYMAEHLFYKIGKKVFKEDHIAFTPLNFVNRWLLVKPVRTLTREIFYSEKQLTYWFQIPAYALAMAMALKGFAITTFETRQPIQDARYLELDFQKHSVDYELSIHVDYRFRGIRNELAEKNIQIDTISKDSKEYKDAILQAQLINTSIQGYYRVRAEEGGIKNTDKPIKELSDEEVGEELGFQLAKFGKSPMFVDLVALIGSIPEARPPMRIVPKPEVLSDRHLLDLFIERHKHLMTFEALDISFAENLFYYQSERTATDQAPLFSVVFNDPYVKKAMQKIRINKGDSRLVTDRVFQGEVKSLIQKYFESLHKLMITNIRGVHLHYPTEPFAEITPVEAGEAFLSELDNLLKSY